LAAFDTRSGLGSGHGDECKRQQAGIALRDALAQQMAAHMRPSHLVCDQIYPPLVHDVRGQRHAEAPAHAA